MRLKQSVAPAFGISLFLIVALSVSPIAAYAAATTLKKVTVAYTSYSPSVMWFLLEKDLKFFHAEGLEPEFVLVRGGGLAVKGLMAENFDYIVPTAPTLDAIVRGRLSFKVVFTAGVTHFWLVARPEIASIADLKGKAIGISTPGSNSDFLMREMLRRHGLDPLKDATFLSVGASRERFAALTSGAVHATVLSPPLNHKALEIGYKRLAKTKDYVPWPGVGLGTREEKILREPQEIAKMVRASLKGLKFILTQREYIVAKMMQMFRLTREEAMETYDGLSEEYVPSGYFTDQDERTVISVAKQAANVTEDIPNERVFDNRFIKQAERELKGRTSQIPK